MMQVSNDDWLQRKQFDFNQDESEKEKSMSLHLSCYLYITTWLIKFKSSCICCCVSCCSGSYSLHHLLSRSYILTTASGIIIISPFSYCEQSHHIFIFMEDNLISFSFFFFLRPIKSWLPHDCGLLCLSPAPSRLRPRLIFSTVLLTICYTIQDCFHPSLNCLSVISITMAAFYFFPFFFSSLFPGFMLVLETYQMTFGPSAPPGIRPVTHLYLSEVTSDSVSVAWSAPAPPADLFILSYSSADGTDTSKVTLDGSKTRSLVQGLLPSTQYTISLITIQGDVTSEPITASLTTGELLDFMTKWCLRGRQINMSSMLFLYAIASMHGLFFTCELIMRSRAATNSHSHDQLMYRLMNYMVYRNVKNSE